ncbi:hypothetical protein CMV_018488 [Castanea mollissima]|uniref:F-box domain-containing protein n=1 Tax=Castanea mollissima TaxID=60419 RepID=A0A8J4R0X7_9ROSI|nr:hypothetical protein CMV_018488 [Castanea mollissima]
MDESGLIQKPKRQKLIEEQDIDKESLDNLPCEIVQYILSLLPTKDAARTSILSKSWKNRWMCIPNLVFRQMCHDVHSTQQLFSGFPVLKNLCLDECHWMNQKVVSICVPKLSCLVIHEAERKRWSDLNEASIYACGSKKRPRQVVANRIYKFLIGFSNAKGIMLSSFAVKVFSLSSDCKKDDSILDPVPPCLLSQLNCIIVCCYNGDEKELSAIKILLKNALVLNKIVIYCSEHLAGDLEKREKAMAITIDGMVAFVAIPPPPLSSPLSPHGL